MFRYFLLSFGSAGVLALDLLTKKIASENLTESIELLPFLSLELTHNTGVAFGIALPRLFTIVASFAAIALLVWLFIRQVRADSRLGTVAFTLLIGGAIGNLFERIWLGEVTDFIRFWLIPNFNLADAALSIGVILLLLFSRRVFKADFFH